MRYYSIKCDFNCCFKKDSTPHSAIHPQLAEVVVFLHFKDKFISKAQLLLISHI